VTESRRREIRFQVAGIVGHGVAAALLGTVRVIREGEEHYRRFRDAGIPFVHVLWHGHLLPLCYDRRGEGITVLVSQHDDGEYVVRLLHRLGFRTVRGSSSRGGVQGLKGLFRAARDGSDLGITPDGPRGPRHIFKPGALLPAARLGLPIVPMAAGASRGWLLGSWDRFLVPKPLSTVRIAYGPPRWIPREAGESELERYAEELQEELNRLTRRCGGIGVGEESGPPGEDGAAGGRYPDGEGSG